MDINKKQKIILIIWFIFISIIILILLLLLGLSLPKLRKINQQQNQNQVQTQYQYQTQYIHDTNKVEAIIKLLTNLKQLKELNQKKKQIQSQIINNLNFFNYEVQNQLYHELSKELDKIVVPKEQLVETQPQISDGNNQLIKDIAVVTLATGAVIISCVVLTPIFASVGPIAAPLALFCLI